MSFWGYDKAHEGQLGPFNTLGLDDELFPGVPGLDNYKDPRVCPVEIDGTIASKFHDAKAHGNSGHKRTYQGYDSKKQFTVEVKIYRAEQWTAFLAWLQKYGPKAQAAVAAEELTAAKKEAAAKAAAKRQKALKAAAKNGNGATQWDLGLRTLDKADEGAAEAYKKVANASYYVAPSPRDARAWRVTHPFLQGYQIEKCTIDSFTLPKPGDSRQVRVVTMVLTESYELKPAKVQEIKSSGGAPPAFKKSFALPGEAAPPARSLKVKS